MKGQIPMNEEEKQAIGFLKHSLYEYEEIDTSVLEYIDKNHKIIYKLILKQQKEIKELEDEVMKKELLIDGMKEERRIAIEEIREQYYVSKDKIKEILKKLENYNFKGNFDDMDFIQSIIQQFKELLGE